MMYLIILAAEVMNIIVESITETSVRVSWNSTESLGITGYIIYYKLTSDKGMNEKNMTVEGSVYSVIITDLVVGNEYEFEVVAVAIVDGVLVSGFRSASKKVVLMATESFQDNGIRKRFIYSYIICMCYLLVLKLTLKLKVL